MKLNQGEPINDKESELLVMYQKKSGESGVSKAEKTEFQEESVNFVLLLKKKLLEFAAWWSLVAFHWNGENGCYWSGLRGSEVRNWQLWSIFKRSFALIGEQRREAGEYGFREL